MKKIIGLVAVRTESTRLKNKAFSRILGKPIIEILIDRLKETPYLDDFIICTTELESDNDLEQFCKIKNVKCFRGESKNVLKRFVDASRLNPSNYIVRITGDNPLTDFESMHECFLYMESKGFDYSRPIGVPYGTAAEVIRTKSLYELLERSLTSDMSEYMTYFFELAPFIKSALYKVDKDIYLPELRLTIDYENDLLFVKKLIENFDGRVPPLKKIVEYCCSLDNYPKVYFDKKKEDGIKKMIKFN